MGDFKLLFFNSNSLTGVLKPPNWGVKGGEIKISK
jgi:hypothetical protein